MHVRIGTASLGRAVESEHVDPGDDGEGEVEQRQRRHRWCRAIR